MEDILLDENRCPCTQSDGNGVAGPGVNDELSFSPLDVNQTIIGVFPEIVDDDMANFAIKGVNETADEIVGQRSTGGSLF